MYTISASGVSIGGYPMIFLTSFTDKSPDPPEDGRACLRVDIMDLSDPLRTEATFSLYLNPEFLAFSFRLISDSIDMT